MTTPFFKIWLRAYNRIMVSMAYGAARMYTDWLKMLTFQGIGEDTSESDIRNSLVNVDPPDWQTNLQDGNYVVDESPYHRLWLFHQGSRGAILDLPPYAGRKGEVVDKQIRKLKSLDHTIYVFELKEADEKNQDLTLDGYVDILEACLDLIGVPVILIGGCQGAWASFILNCRNSDKIKAYVNLAGPLNFSAGEGRIKDNCRRLGDGFFRQIVNLSGGRQPGWVQWLGFSTMAPSYFSWKRYLNLFRAIVEMRLHGNTRSVYKWITERNWLDEPRDLPGPWYIRVVKDLFVGDKLRKGELIVKDERVDPTCVRNPVLSVAGANDEITPSRQLDIREDLPRVPWYEHHVLPGHGHTKTLISDEAVGAVKNFVRKILAPG